MGLWSLKSLVKAAAADVGVVVHDDGSLTEDDAVLLKEQLPGLRIIRRAEAICWRPTLPAGAFDSAR